MTKKKLLRQGGLFSLREGNDLIHGKLIVPHNVKVFVDDVVSEFKLNSLTGPCDEHETVFLYHVMNMTLGDPAASFVEWPKDLVTLGQVQHVKYFFCLFKNHSILFF